MVVVGVGNTACDAAVDLSSVCSQVISYDLPLSTSTKFEVSIQSPPITTIGKATHKETRKLYYRKDDRAIRRQK